MSELILSILEQTFIYAIMSLGVYISYQILNFPDLSIDGSFPFGAAVTAVLILKGVNPILTLLIVLVLGSLIGLITGLIHVRLKVSDLLSGILVMTALYSVNLRIAGTSNLPLFGEKTIFNNALVESFPAFLKPYATLLIVFVLIVVIKLALDMYLKTKSGFLLRAVGDNPTLVTSLAKNPDKVKIFGLMLGNALVAVSGGVLCQYQRFFEITMGQGKMVMGLASVIIGMSVFAKLSKLKGTTTAILGMLIYQIAIAGAIKLGLQSGDLKLITSILFLVALVINRKDIFTGRKKHA